MNPVKTLVMKSLLDVFQQPLGVVIVFLFLTQSALGLEPTMDSYLPISFHDNNYNIYWDASQNNFYSHGQNQSTYYSSRKTPQDALNATSIRIAAALEYVHDVNYTIENGSYVFTGGYIYESFKYIAESYNLEIVSMNGQSYASTKTDSNATDMGTMLMNDECDVAISLHEFNFVRLSKFSYLHPHYESRLWAYFVQPPPSSIRDIYHYVFTFESWMAVLLTWILIISMLWAITYIKQITSVPKGNPNESLSELLIWVIGAACQNGVAMNPESLSLKIAVLCSLLTGLFIYLVYSAAIVSILAWDVVPVKNVSDMTSSKFKFYTNYASPSVEMYMKKLRNEVPYLRSEGKIVNMEPITAFENVIREENVVFLALDDNLIRRSIAKLPAQLFCNSISPLKVFESPIPQAMLIQKRSPWREYLNIKLLWEMNTGILHRIKTRYRKLTTLQCLRDPQSQHQIKSLGWTDIFSAVITLIILYSVSLLCFSAEKLLVLRHYKG